MGPAAAVAPAVVVASQKRPAALLETDLPHNRLVFDRVYLNGMHALRKFTLRNTAGARLLVKLRSNLARNVAFQLSNDNLIGDVVASGDEYNELFNTVGHIDEVELARDEARDIIVAFRPEPATTALLGRRPAGTDGATADAEESYERQELNGLLLLYAYILSDPVQPPTQLPTVATSEALASPVTDLAGPPEPTTAAGTAVAGSVAAAVAVDGDAVPVAAQGGPASLVAGPTSSEAPAATSRRDEPADLAKCDQQVHPLASLVSSVLELTLRMQRSPRRPRAHCRRR